MKAYLPVFALIALILIATGCGGRSAIKNVQDAEEGNQRIAEEDIADQRAYNYFVNGSIFETIGEPYLAFQQYREALNSYPESQEIRYSFATAALRIKEYDAALTAARGLSPDNERTWLLLASCYRVLDSARQALYAYQRAAEHDSSDAQLFYQIAAYYQRFEMFDSAAVAFRRVTDLSPAYNTFQQLATLQMRAGMYNEALESYLQAVAMDSSVSNVRSFLGLVFIYENRGERDKALENLEIAARLAPRDALILTRLLTYYEDNNDYDRAIETAKQIIPLAPQDNNIVRRLGVLYYAVDSLRLADSLFTSLLNFEGNNAIDLYYAGRTAVMLDDYERAKKNFTRVTALADSVADGWLNLGLVYRLQDSTDLEIATYEKGLPFMNNILDSIGLLFPMGSAFERIGRFDRSVEVFEIIIDLQPQHAPALNYLGYMLADKGIRLNEARRMIERALELDPENGAYIDSYGWVLFKLGKHSQALEQLLKAVTVITDDPVVMEHLGDAYKAVGDNDNAEKYWRKTLELDPDNTSVKEKMER
ncbi:MAG: tetratricopeptide repeat protein [candidate division Zixibacteria bacterium]|nr:tetratricopeptide repeat protein [candidate division Zixibacteria bacterium]